MMERIQVARYKHTSRLKYTFPSGWTYGLQPPPTTSGLEMYEAEIQIKLSHAPPWDVIQRRDARVSFFDFIPGSPNRERHFAGDKTS